MPLTQEEIKAVGDGVADAVKAATAGLKAELLAELKPETPKHDTSGTKAAFNATVTKPEEPSSEKNFDGYLRFVKDTFGIDVTKYMDPEDAKWKSHKLRDPRYRELVKDFMLGTILPAKDAMSNRTVMDNYEKAVKALNLTTTGGGYLVPAEVANEVIYTMGDWSAIRDMCRVVPMVSATENWPTVTGTHTTYWPGTNTAITDSDPTFGQAPLVAKPHGVLTYLPRQLAFSTKIDVVRLIVDLAAEALAEGEENAFTTGNGSNKPYGFTDSNWSSIASVSMDSSALAYADLVHLMFSISKKYRRRGAWALSSEALRLITALQDENHRPIWSAPVDGLPGTIIGRPYYEIEYIPDDEGSSPNYTTRIYYGAYKQSLLIGDQQQMVMESSTEAGTSTFAAHQLAVKVMEFVDFYVADQSALKYLTGVI